MPKSKRDKTVSLTKTPKRSNLLHKQVLAQAVRNAVDRYDFVYVFSVVNMRNSKLKDLRSEWGDSRFFMGKTKVMKFGLGQTPETESGANIHQLAKVMDLQSGLLFTNRPAHQVFPWFLKYKEEDFARAGTTASKTVTLRAGPMPQFSFAIETHLRGLGMPTRLDRSVVVLASDFTVCTRGEVLRPDQTRMLKLLGIKLARFRVTVKCCWTKSSGAVTYPEEAASEEEEDIDECMDQADEDHADQD